MKMDEEEPIECKIIFSISNLQQGADLGSVDPKEANKSSEKCLTAPKIAFEVII